MRVYELARELGAESKELLAACKKLGFKQTNRLAGVAKDEATALRKLFRDKAGSAKASAPAAPKAGKPKKAKPAERAPSRGKVRQKKPGAKPPPAEVAEGMPEIPTPFIAGAKKRKKTRAARPASEEEGDLFPRVVPLPGRYVPPSAVPHYPRRSARRPRIKRSRARAPVASRSGSFAIQVPVSIKDFSAVTGVKANAIILKLMGHGMLVNINAMLDEEQVRLVVAELGLDVTVRRAVTAESAITALEQQEDKPEDLQLRAPVVAFLGHVDHGKTSLLDRIRKTNVAAQEHGGITQHIAAYRVTIGGHTVVFLDTPGHEAFTAMRARGANATDIVALVVAADDGVMPQTEEAINHARAAGVPIVAVINKCDKGEANPMRVKQQLANLNLQPEEWGGDTVCVEVSAQTGQGLEELIEMLSLVAELAELKANANKPARGIVLEANVSGSRGPIATVLVREGTLRIGEVVLCGATHGRVKAMFDDQNRPLREAGPSTPVMVVGLDGLPQAGDSLIVLHDLHQARAIAEERQRKAREEGVMARRHVTLENLFASLEEGEVSELLLILKADVRGTLEALSQVVERIRSTEVRTRVLHSSVGGITISDVLLADASDAIIVGLNVAPDVAARALAEEKGVSVRVYNVIYRVKEEIERALTGMLKPEEREVVVGHAEVRRIFRISRLGNIAGCFVTDGLVGRNYPLRLIREGVVVHEGRLASLRREKDDVREVREGFECGLHLDGYEDIKIGDVIETFRIEKVARTLDSTAPGATPTAT